MRNAKYAGIRWREVLWVVLLVALLLFVGQTFGGELKIKVRSWPPGQPLKPGTAVLISIDGLEAGQVVVWHRTGVEGDEVFQVGEHFLFGGTKPGKRTIIAQVPSPGQDPFATATFQYGGSEDETDDDANPTPPPGPIKDLWVLVVEDRSKRGKLSPKRLQALLDRSWRETLKKNGHRFLLIDKSPSDETGNVPAEHAGWIKIAESLKDKQGQPVSLPVVLVVGDGRLVEAVAFPETVEAVSALVEKYGGK